MATITRAQAMQYATTAGFTGNARNIIVAIAQAESSFNTLVQHRNTNGTTDRGVLQINNGAHPEVSDACAFSPACAFQQGYRISSQGTNFRPWTTFTSGAYLKYMVNDSTITATATGGEPWYDYPTTQPYGLPYEPGLGGHHGLDLGVPIDTPVTAILPGIVTNIDTTDTWGIGVTWKLDQPYNGATYMAIIHLDAVNPQMKVGSHVVAGSLLGWSGGENSTSQIGSATNPTGKHFIDSAAMSGGPHVHVSLLLGPEYGVGAGWDDPTKYPNLNPQPLINAVKAGSILQPSTGQPMTGLSVNITQQNATASGFAQAPIVISSINDAYMQAGQTAHDVLAHTPGFLGICEAVDDAEQFPGIYNAFSGDDNPLDAPANAVMTVLGTIGGNSWPLIIRVVMIAMGFLLVVGLVMKTWEPYQEEALGVLTKVL